MGAGECHELPAGRQQRREALELVRLVVQQHDGAGTVIERKRQPQRHRAMADGPLDGLRVRPGQPGLVSDTRGRAQAAGNGLESRYQPLLGNPGGGGGAVCREILQHQPPWTPTAFKVMSSTSMKQARVSTLPIFTGGPRR